MGSGALYMKKYRIICNACMAINDIEEKWINTIESTTLKMVICCGCETYLVPLKGNVIVEECT